MAIVSGYGRMSPAAISAKVVYFAALAPILMCYLLQFAFYRKFGLRFGSLSLAGAFASLANPVLFFAAIFFYMRPGNVVNVKPFYRLRLYAAVFSVLGAGEPLPEGGLLGLSSVEASSFLLHFLRAYRKITGAVSGLFAKELLASGDWVAKDPAVRRAVEDFLSEPEDGPVLPARK